jgi:AAA+ ATPase superfamily predicted ATPase
MASVGTTPFYGRENELRRLHQLAGKKTASLVIIKGRRRIGKSRLATEFARQLTGYRALSFQGLPPTAHLTAEHEREDFAQQIHRQLGIPAPRADDWNALLWTLADRTRVGRHLIVLDEINWLGSKDPTFLGKLKNIWDAELSQNPHLILILSGSLSGWIERNILHHTGFLGRVSLDFTLPELPLAACNLFWGKYRDRVTPYEKLRLLSVTGGVPRYLEEMDPALSADVNIQRMCFTPEGMLFKEFDLIFHDLFSKRDNVYREIVAALVNGPLDLEGLYAALGVGKSGLISEYSADLVQAGFLSRDYTWDLKTAHEGKHSKLRLSDNYLRFYLKYVQPNHRRIERGTLSRLPNMDGILGLQFENIVLKSRLAIFKLLHIDPNDVLYDNPFFQRKTLRQAGSQIDYMIHVRQKTLYVCEIKFSHNAVASTVISEVQEKIARLSMPRHVSYRPVLIHAGDIAESIAEQDYFSSVIDFGELLASGDEST